MHTRLPDLSIWGVENMTIVAKRSKAPFTELLEWLESGGSRGYAAFSRTVPLPRIPVQRPEGA